MYNNSLLRHRLRLSSRMSLRTHQLTPIVLIVGTLSICLVKIFGMLFAELCIADAATAWILTQLILSKLIESSRMFDRMARLLAPIDRMNILRVIVEPECE